MDEPASHYFSRQPAVGSSERIVELSLPDVELSFITDRGVFSGDRIDTGTRFLLQTHADFTRPQGHVLDIGCGYGPIAITAAKRMGLNQVWAIDVNERAVELCWRNALRNDVNVLALVVDENGIADTTFNRDLFAKHDADPALVDGFGEITFAEILSNPPIRIGKSALQSLLVTWLSRLDSNGHAYLVVQKHLGADSLTRWLNEQDWPTQRLASRAGYRILDVTRE